MSIVDKLTPYPPLAENVKETRKPKPPLTQEETDLWTRAQTFIASALQRHGIGLAPREIPWIGAEVADFVVDEKAGPEKVAADKAAADAKAKAGADAAAAPAAQTPPVVPPPAAQNP